MIAGVVRETFPGERRVAIVPAVMPSLKKDGIELFIERGAGLSAGFPDQEYVDRGARIAPSRAEVFQSAEVILQVRAYGANPEAGRGDLENLRSGQAVIGFFEPLTATAAVKETAAAGATLFSMELMPRSTRAQSMDALSSMATVAGYKAVVLAAGVMPKMFPLMMTAAGTVAPARVFIVGAGVAGLQAIATARRLGALVEAYDIRPTVKQEIESLGAKFIELPLETTDAQDSGGYAKVQDESFYRRQRETMSRVVADCDAVITTAAVPGKKAPVLLTKEMVAGMQPGSVIVDLAAERGGNCELTRPGETRVENGVTILGPVNLAATIPYHASNMYARNITTFLRHLCKEGRIQFDLNDEITRETLVTRGGEIVHPLLREALGLARETVTGQKEA